MPRIPVLLFVLLLTSANVSSQPAPLRLKFDTAAVEGFLRAANREPLSDVQVQEIAFGRGSQQMVRNTIKYVPGTPADGNLKSLRELAHTGAIKTDDFGLGDAIAGVDTVKRLLTAIKRDERAMSDRIIQRMLPFWRGQASLEITVYLVVGGASDGFLVDGESAPEFYIAIDKASGDIAGLEQNVAHETVHVLQRQLGLRHCPQLTSIEQQAPVTRFHTTIYEQGVANYLADPRHIHGEGDYIATWRGRYQRNDTPARMRENAWLYASLLDGLRQGALTWDTAYQIGFYGNLDSRMYFVGRELARRHEAVGRSPLSADFVCRPEEFFCSRSCPFVGLDPSFPSRLGCAHGPVSARATPATPGA